MLDRSRARHMLAVAVAAGLIAAGPARAAEAPVAVPADAPTVATAPSGAALIAWAAGARTCLVFQDAGQPRPARLFLADTREDEQNGLCETTPVLPEFGASALWERGMGDGRSVAWGVAGPGAARIEARAGSSVMAGATASLAPLPGAATDLRFWLMEARQGGTTNPDEIALLDAAGSVRRAFAPFQVGNFSFATTSYVDDPAQIGQAVLRHGTRRGTAWQLRRLVRRVLSPTPLEPERRVELRCVVFRTRNGQGADGAAGGPCDRGLLDAVPFVVEAGAECGVGAHVDVVARPDVAKVVVVLGDGTRRAVPLVALGGEYRARAGTLVVGTGMAIRRVTGYAASGRPVSTWPVAHAPEADDDTCDTVATDFIATRSATPRGTAGAAPHAPHVTDSGANVCVAVDRLPRVPEECAPPPAGPEDAEVASLPTAGSDRYVYGIVPLEVTAARIALDDGSTATVATEPIAGYAGPYAGVLRQVAYDAPGPARPRSVALLDARGRAIGTSRLAYLTPAFGPPATLAPASGGLPALRAARLTSGAGATLSSVTCVEIGTPDDPYDCDLGMYASDAGAGSLQVIARCGPRRLVVLAALRHRADRLLVRTRAGRTITARNLRLPAGTGPAAGHYVALAVVGPHDAVTRLRVTGRRTQDVTARYPAAARQCGYTDRPPVAFTPPPLD